MKMTGQEQNLCQERQPGHMSLVQAVQENSRINQESPRSRSTQVFASNCFDVPAFTRDILSLALQVIAEDDDFPSLRQTTVIRPIPGGQLNQTEQ
jgi:hypothetical protein